VPFAGQSVGLIHDIRPAREIIIDTVEEAERIIGSVMSQYAVPAALVGAAEIAHVAVRPLGVGSFA
jgi:hypothetical protein